MLSMTFAIKKTFKCYYNEKTKLYDKVKLHKFNLITKLGKL